MAEKKQYTATTSTGDTVTASEGTKVEPEPFHAVAEEMAGEVFDPNAAARAEAGIGPGLQDSEAIHPARWVAEPTAEEMRDAQVKQLQREIDRLKKQQDKVKKGEA
jgi:hypothetical protein